MEDRRIYLDAHQHTQRGKLFALLVILGLAVVASVWFLQLRTLFRRGEVAEVNERVAAFQEGLQAEWAALEDEASAPADSPFDTASDAVRDLIAEEIIKNEAKDAIGSEVAETLNEDSPAPATGETTAEEVADEDTVTPTTPEEGVAE